MEKHLAEDDQQVQELIVLLTKFIEALHVSELLCSICCFLQNAWEEGRDKWLVGAWVNTLN